MSRYRAHKRLGLFMGLSVLFLVALLGRTFYVQVVAAPALKQQATGQHVRTLTLDAPRGTISDRNGNALAISRTMASVYADLRNIKDAEDTAAKLSPVLGVPAEDLLQKLSGAPTSFKYLVRKVDPAVGAKVKAMNLKGIGVLAEPKRVYPKGALAPQLLGFVGGSEYTGMEGLEYQYDSVLSGQAGEMQIVRDLLGNRLSTVSTSAARPGKSLTLTIDAEIQFEAEKALTDAVEEFQAKRACALVMEPKTGEILAMASTPVFSPEDRSAAVASGSTRNWIVTDMYEPGSTFKMVTVAAALENRVVTPDTEYTLPSQLVAVDRVIHEAEEHVATVRKMTVTQILAKSSNIGAITIGREVGKDLLTDMIKKFGFTKKLGIDFPGETAGQLPDKWNGVTIYQVPMGQGIAVSALQLATAYAAIANDGLMVQPHLVRDALQPWTRRVVSPTVAAQLRGMLQVTVESGTGKKAQLEGYSVAGKTGTAQKPNEKKKGYSDEVISSFVGMIPADSPRLVILVMMDEPQTERLGGNVAAPVFNRIADFAVKRLSIPPSGYEDDSTVETIYGPDVSTSTTDAGADPEDEELTGDDSGAAEPESD